MFRHSSLLDRSRTNLAQLAKIRRMHRVKAAIELHVDVVGEVVADFGSLPLCFRDEYLVIAVDRALDNSVALYSRVEGWTFEEGEVVEEKVVDSAEEYLKRCSSILGDVLEGIRALRALVPEEEKEDDEETVNEQEDEKVIVEQDEEQEDEGMDEDEEQVSDDDMTEDEEEEDDV
jgi:hypothetical protein